MEMLETINLVEAQLERNQAMLDQMQHEMTSLGQQVEAMRRLMEAQVGEAAPAPAQPTSAVPIPPVLLKQEPTPQPTPQPTPTQPAPKDDLESTFSKAILPICASILIFISAVCLALTALPILTDLAKVLLMYIVSLLIILGGAFLTLRERDNKVYRSILACGMGVLYITLFMSDLYFGLINDLVLYIGLLIWAFVLTILAMGSSEAFLLIGEIGVLIATILGTSLCVKDQDLVKYCIVILYMVLTQLIYRTSRLCKNQVQTITYQIFTSVLCTIILVGLNLLSENYHYWASFAPFAILFLVNGYHKQNLASKITAMLYAMILLFDWMHDGMAFVWGLLFIIAFLALQSTYREQYHAWVKIIAYLWFFFFSQYRLLEMVNALSGDLWIAQKTLRLFVFVALCLLNLFVSKLSICHKNLATGEEEKGLFITTKILGIILWVTSIILIGTYRQQARHIVAIVIATILTLSSTTRLVKPSGGRYGVLYMIKLLILAKVIMQSFYMGTYFLSITRIVLSIVGIAIGFVLQEICDQSYKPMRIFCLVATMVSIMQIVLYGATGSTDLQRTISFFLGGVMCFAISLIYNFVDKKIKRQHDEA